MFAIPGGLEVRRGIGWRRLLQRERMRHNLLFDEDTIDIRHWKVERLQLPCDVGVPTKERHFLQQSLRIELGEYGIIPIVVACDK